MKKRGARCKIFWEHLSQFYDNATGLFGMPDISFSFVDIVEILIISFLFYHILLWIKNTRALESVQRNHRDSAVCIHRCSNLSR